MEHFPRWPFCAGNSLVTVEFPTQRPVTRSFYVSLICASINDWGGNREAGDLRRHRAHYDVTVMKTQQCASLSLIVHFINFFFINFSVTKLPFSCVNKGWLFTFTETNLCSMIIRHPLIVLARISCLWVRIGSHLWGQCETWVWFFTPTWNGYANHKSLPKRLLSSPQHQENPKMPEPGSHVHDYACIYYKPDWLRQQFDEWTARESHQETPACAKHSCQTSFQSEEIWSHNSCITLHWLQVKYRIEFKTLLIVFKGLHGKAPTYIQDTLHWLQVKYRIKFKTLLIVFKGLHGKAPTYIQDTFGKRAFAVYGPLAWNCLPKEIRLSGEIEAIKRNLQTHLFVKFVNESTLANWFWKITALWKNQLGYLPPHARILCALWTPHSPFECESVIVNSVSYGVLLNYKSADRVLPSFWNSTRLQCNNFYECISTQVFYIAWNYLTWNFGALPSGFPH